MVDQLRAAHILRMRDVMARLNLSKSAVYDRLNPRSPRFDPTFPRPVRLGKNARAVGIIESQLDAYIQKMQRVA